MTVFEKATLLKLQTLVKSTLYSRQLNPLGTFVKGRTMRRLWGAFDLVGFLGRRGVKSRLIYPTAKGNYTIAPPASSQQNHPNRPIPESFQFGKGGHIDGR
jgi:hypothetical protein